jgi:hypothetical protein
MQPMGRHIDSLVGKYRHQHRKSQSCRTPYSRHDEPPSGFGHNRTPQPLRYAGHRVHTSARSSASKPRCSQVLHSLWYGRNMISNISSKTAGPSARVMNAITSLRVPVLRRPTTARKACFRSACENFRLARRLQETRAPAHPRLRRAGEKHEVQQHVKMEDDENARREDIKAQERLDIEHRQIDRLFQEQHAVRGRARRDRQIEHERKKAEPQGLHALGRMVER